MPREWVASGLADAGQDLWPEGPKAHSRWYGLDSVAIIVDDTGGYDAGGAPRDGWTPRDSAVPARLDYFTITVGGAVGGKVDENSEAIVSFLPDTDITTANRILINDKTWVVTALRDRTNELIVRVEVREL